VSVAVVGVAGAWGVLAAVVVLSRRGRAEVRARFPRRPRRRRPAPTTVPVPRIVRSFRAGRRARRDAAAVDRALPATLDLLVVAVDAGAPPRNAVELAARWAPAAVAAPLRDVLVTTDLGGAFPDALATLGARQPGLAPVAEVLTASARLGAPAAAALTRLADEARAAARRRAEARARVLPVKLLFPLVFLVLPAFGLLTVVPALLSAMDRL
jgi:tight adherence protein C